jgi:hypothetical protein
MGDRGLVEGLTYSLLSGDTRASRVAKLYTRM